MLAEFWGKTSLCEKRLPSPFGSTAPPSHWTWTSQVPQPTTLVQYTIQLGTLSLNMDQLLTRLPVWAPSTGLLIIKDLPITKSPKLLPPPPLPKKERKTNNQEKSSQKPLLANWKWGFGHCYMYGIWILYFSIYLVGWSLVIGDDAQKRGA